MTRTAALAALHKARLYAILDTGYSKPEDWPALGRQLIDGGAGIVQIRAKGASRDDIVRWSAPVIPLFHAAGIPLILNDYPDLVPVTGAAGCHVGQDDIAVAEARSLAGPEAIIGKSTHSLAQAVAGEAEGPDYLGFGPIFATPTKPTYVPIGMDDIAEAGRRVSIPWFCIGGIKKENTATLAVAGAQRVVIVSGLLTAPDPAAYAREVLKELNREGAKTRS